MKTQTPSTTESTYNSADLAERAIQRRAIEAVIWGMPTTRMPSYEIRSGLAAHHRLRDYKRMSMVLLGRQVENRTQFLLIPMGASRSWPASMVR
jgi:hypothetical protein